MHYSIKIPYPGVHVCFALFFIFRALSRPLHPEFVEIPSHVSTHTRGNVLDRRARAREFPAFFPPGPGHSAGASVPRNREKRGVRARASDHKLRRTENGSYRGPFFSRPENGLAPKNLPVCIPHSSPGALSADPLPSPRRSLSRSRALRARRRPK